MLLKSLTLVNVRAFRSAEFSFQPGMNLIVGINGVGKSTVLDTLRIVLSRVLPDFPQVRFTDLDILVGQQGLSVTLEVKVNGDETQHIVNYLRDWDKLPLTPKLESIYKSSKQALIAIYFSPRRALPDITPLNNRLIASRTKGIAAATADALNHRELRLTEFAGWWFAQTTLAAEGDPTAQRLLEIFTQAITRFLDSCSNIQVQRQTYTHRSKNGKETQKSTTTLTINKAGIPLDFRQLSDGERGILAIVLDLARRLSQANPNLEDPLQAQAVVLIDELDLHLHPKWQRTIVQKLTTTFPNCQFIATTHSPQIIGEVPPESIILLEEGQPPMRPDQSIGMDTDWILKYLMDAPTRNHETEQELKRIAELIETEDYDEASNAIDHLRETIGEFPELVRLQTRIDRLQLLGE